MESGENFEATKDLDIKKSLTEKADIENMKELSLEEKEFAEKYSKSLEVQKNDIDFSKEENLNHWKITKDYYKWKFPETVANITRIANEAGFKNLFIHVDTENVGGEFENKYIHIKKGYENCVFFPNKGMENQQLLEKVDKDFADKGLGIVMRHEKEHFKEFVKNYNANEKFFGKKELSKLNLEELNRIKEKDDYANYILEELTRFGESQTNLQSIVNDSGLSELTGDTEEVKSKRIKKVIDDIATDLVYIQSIYKGIDSFKIKKEGDLVDFLANSIISSYQNQKSLDMNFSFLKPEIISKITERQNEIILDLLDKYDKFLEDEKQKNGKL